VGDHRNSFSWRLRLFTPTYGSHHILTLWTLLAGSQTCESYGSHTCVMRHTVVICESHVRDV